MSPRTEEQYEEIRQEKRQLIMEVALNQFAHNGYKSTTISQIAKKAEISKGLLYNYFTSKEELLDAILNNGIDAMLKVFDPNKDGVLETEEMEYFITEIFKMIAENRHYWKLYFSVSLQPSVFKMIEKRMDKLIEPLGKMTVEYFEKHNFEYPLAETFIFGALLDGVAFDYIMKPDVYPLEMVKNEIIDRYCKPKSKKS